MFSHCLPRSPPSPRRSAPLIIKHVYGFGVDSCVSEHSVPRGAADRLVPERVHGLGGGGGRGSGGGGWPSPSGVKEAARAPFVGMGLAVLLLPSEASVSPTSAQWMLTPESLCIKKFFFFFFFQYAHMRAFFPIILQREGGREERKGDREILMRKRNSDW